MVHTFLCAAEPAAAPPTNHFMVSLIDPLAVRARAFSSLCFGLRLPLPLRELLPGVLQSQNPSTQIVHVSSFPHLQASQFCMSVTTLGDFFQQYSAPIPAKDCPGLMTSAHSRHSEQAVAYRDTTHRGLAIAEAR